MEVRTIDAIPLVYPLGENRGYGSARGTVDQRTATLVRIQTADGTTGWGEAFGPPRTVATLIDEVIADVVTGMDPYQVESLCSQQFAGLYHFGTRGLVQSAISGVDIALWDIIGRSQGTSVSRLLGGRTRAQVTPYASTMYVTEWDEDPAVPIERAVSEGFEAAKIKIGRGLDDDIERVRSARDILGSDADLMVDCNGNYRADQAARLVDTLASFDVTWLEEPLPPENRSGYGDLGRNTSIPLAFGEASYARFEFREIIENRLVDIVQPDVCKCGGLSEARFIAKLATTENLAVSPHIWSSAVGLAASLQFAATVPDYPHSTNVPDPFFFEVDRADNGLREELVEGSFAPTGGTLDVPDEPGLGITIDETAVDRYRVD